RRELVRPHPRVRPDPAGRRHVRVRPDYRRGDVMRIRKLSLILAMMALAPGCAEQEDWIQRTQVTVDVTGTWFGTSTTCTACGSTIEVRVELEQQGAKVVGNMQLIGPIEVLGGNVSPEIDGSVAGDVFRFKQRSGLRPMTGEMTVDGERMTGSI